MKTVAHRLYAGEVPENSFSGIDLVLRRRPYAIETDVQLTADNIPVLLHDKLLDRTTSLSGYLSNYSFPELSQRGILTDGFGIPTLRELLFKLSKSGIKIYLEVINPSDIPHILSVTRDFQDTLEITFSSFHHELIRDLSESMYSTMCLFECVPLNIESFILETKATEIGIGFDSVSPSIVNACRRLEKPCYAWTVNAEQELKRARELGLDGVFTDFGVTS